MAKLTVLDLAAFDAVLKELYPTKEITEEIDNNTQLLQKVETRSDLIDYTGKQAVIPLKYGRNQGVGARAEGGTLPAAGAGRYENTLLKVKYNYAKVKISGITAYVSRKESGAFANAIDEAISDTLESLKIDVNRQLMGDGTGKIARVLSVAGQIITLDQPLEDPCKYVLRDMVIDVYATDGTTNHADSVFIASVDPENNTITITGTISSVVAGDWIYREDSINNEMMGIRGILNHNLIDSLQGIVRSTSSWWQSAYVGTATTTFSTDVLRKLRRKVRSKLGNSIKNLNYWTTLELMDKLGSIKENDKRFYDKVVAPGGLTIPTYLGIPINEDNYCYPQHLFLLKDDSFVFAKASDFEWADLDGHIWKSGHTGASGTDTYEATLFRYANLGSKSPRSNAVETVLDWTL